MTPVVIAIDGPGGSGKTSVSRAVAKRLGLPHLDTGAYYRAATVAVLRAGVDPGEADEVTSCVRSASLDYRGGKMTLDGEDVSEDIRSADVTAAVSEVSAIPEVRQHLVSLQRAWVRARDGSAVVEGRDIGSAVFPDAAVKVYLTARSEIRARRRAAEGPSGTDVSTVAQELDRRDSFDSSRDASPLQQAEGAIVIDTSEMSIDDVIEQVLDLARLAGQDD